MKKSLSIDLIREISIETGIDPAFIEKDWYAVKLISLVSSRNEESGIKAIFSGGTSLSKGHHLIKRFSEDLDFFISTPGQQPVTEGQRRSFRLGVIEDIVGQEDCFQIDASVVIKGDGHRFFKAPVTYPISFEKTSLRPHLQVEMTFHEPRLEPIRKPIHSIASQTLGEPPETEILCISPLETAGDKISALSWRVLVRDRNSENDDPTIVRHLHDLAALEESINQDIQGFTLIALSSLSQDKNRRGVEIIGRLSEAERLTQCLDRLKHDPLYKNEYEQFVLAMSYADRPIHFDQAISSLERLAKLCLKPLAN